MTNPPARTATPSFENLGDALNDLQICLGDGYNYSPDLIKHIVHCVNQHDKLVAALRELLEIVEDEGHASNYVPQVADARAALANEPESEVNQ